MVYDLGSLTFLFNVSLIIKKEGKRLWQCKECEEEWQIGGREEIERTKYNITRSGIRKTIQDSLPSWRRLRTPKLLLFMTDRNTYTRNSRVHWDDGDSRKSVKHNHEPDFRVTIGEFAWKGKHYARIENFCILSQLTYLYILKDGSLILSDLLLKLSLQIIYLLFYEIFILIAPIFK